MNKFSKSIIVGFMVFILVLAGKTNAESTPFVTGQTLGTVRNDWSGWVGAEVTVGTDPITVTALGRWVISGNTETHTVELVQASNGSILGQVAINTSGESAGFNYVTLTSPITLTANTSYYLLSQETDGGDQWYDYNTSLTTASVAFIPNAIWSVNNTSYNPYSTANQCYVPVSFLYATDSGGGGASSGSSASFVTGQTLGTERNNYSGWLGTEITVGAYPITVTALCRWVISGNTDSHTVELVQASNGSILSQVTINTSGESAGFNYVALPSPLTLAPSTSYYILSQETSGADEFYDYNSLLSTTSVAVIDNAIWSNNNATFSAYSDGYYSYVPVSLQYAVSSGGATTALLANKFLNSLGVDTHITQGIDSSTEVATNLTYTGIRNIRDDGTLSSTILQYFINIHNSSGAMIDLLPLVVDNSPYMSQYDTLAEAGALLAVEGPNEPNNFPITYDGETSAVTTTFLPVAEFQRDLYAAVKADSNLTGIPVLASSEAGGSEPDNAGLQFLTIPSGAGTTMQAGTVFADYANTHNYVHSSGLTGVVNNTAWLAEWPTSNVGWDGLYSEYGITWNRGYTGYSPTQLQTLPRVTTETGWVTQGNNAITQDQQGKLFLNLYLDACLEGWTQTFIYMMFDEPSGDWGLFNSSDNPKLSATYIHNMTTILADAGSITPGSLNYSIPDEPGTVHSLLIQKSNGTFYLAVWDERPVGTGTDTVTVNLGGAYSVSEYDPTVGTSATILGSVSSVSLSLSDHPLILAIS